MIIGFENIRYFGTWYFDYCRCLSGTLKFTDDTVIEWGAFSDTGVTGAEFLSGEISVAYYAFGNSSLKFCYIDEKCKFVFEEYPRETKFGSFYECNNLTTVVIPQNVDSLPEPLFNGCNKVTLYSPKGSPAEVFANKRFLAINTELYQQKVIEFRQ